MTHFLHMSIDKPTDVEMTDCYLTEIWKFNARYVMQMGNYCYYHYQGTMATTTIATITTTCQGCHERSGSSGVPVKSTWTHHTTALRTPLAACTTANRVQACRVGVPVSPWTRAGLHDWWSAANCWTSRSTTPMAIIDLGTSCTTDTPSNHRRLRISHCSSKDMEQSAAGMTSSRTLSSFKSKLKTYLFKLSFPHSDSVKWLRCC